MHSGHTCLGDPRVPEQDLCTEQQVRFKARTDQRDKLEKQRGHIREGGEYEEGVQGSRIDINKDMEKKEYKDMEKKDDMNVKKVDEEVNIIKKKNVDKKYDGVNKKEDQDNNQNNQHQFVAILRAGFDCGGDVQRVLLLLLVR